VVGFIERRANIKTFTVVYEARGQDQTKIMRSILEVMDKAGQRLVNVETDAIGELQRVCFSLTAVKRQQERFDVALKAAPGIDKLLTFRDPEED
jgi:putative Mg2+ transporter-C (MgtC) family protein